MKKIAVFLMAAVVVLAITCKKDDKIAVTGVSLDRSTMELAPDGTATLKATVMPENATNKEVTWSSSNSIATVVNGVVTAGATVGEAIITVTTADGSFKANCTVNVIMPEVDVTGVTLAPSALTLVKGATENLTATVQPENASIKTVSWESSDESVVTVTNSGEVTAVDGGEATITVKTSQGNFTATCEVTVTVGVESVEIPEEVTVMIDEEITIQAIVLPENATNKTVTWSVDEAGEAFVSIEADDETGELTITGIAEGTATITVTTEDGEFTAECVVTVVGEIAVSGVKLNFAEMELPLGASTRYLKATVEPTGSATSPPATNRKVTWSSNSANVSVDEETGELTAMAQGTATITVTTDDGGYTATCVVTVLADPMELLCGADSKVWTWNYEEYGHKCFGMADLFSNEADWWAVGNGWQRDNEYIGATMTFSKTGALLKTDKDGNETEGLFSIDLTSKYPKYSRSLGQLSTDGITILRALSTMEGNEEQKVFEILKMNEEELMLAVVDYWDGYVNDKGEVWHSPDEQGWGQATIWLFRPGEYVPPEDDGYPKTPDDPDVCGEDAKVIWQGRKEISWGSSGAVALKVEDFEDLPAGTIMTLHFRLIEEQWGQAQICQGGEGWPKIIFDEFNGDPEAFKPTDIGGWGNWGYQSQTFVLTQDILDGIVGNPDGNGIGVYIQGSGILFTKVTLCAP